MAMMSKSLEGKRTEPHPPQQEIQSNSSIKGRNELKVAALLIFEWEFLNFKERV